MIRARNIIKHPKYRHKLQWRPDHCDQAIPIKLIVRCLGSALDSFKPANRSTIENKYQVQTGNKKTAHPPTVGLKIAIGINRIDRQNGNAEVSFAMDGVGTKVMVAAYMLIVATLWTRHPKLNRGVASL